MYFTMLLKLNENSRDMSSCPSPGCTCVDVIAAAVPLWAEFCRRGGALSRPSVAANGGEPHTWQHCGSTVALLRVPWLVLGAARGTPPPRPHRGGGGIGGIPGRHVPPARASVRHEIYESNQGDESTGTSTVPRYSCIPWSCCLI